MHTHFNSSYQNVYDIIKTAFGNLNGRHSDSQHNAIILALSSPPDIFLNGIRLYFQHEKQHLQHFTPSLFVNSLLQLIIFIPYNENSNHNSDYDYYLSPTLTPQQFYNLKVLLHEYQYTFMNISECVDKFFDKMYGNELVSHDFINHFLTELTNSSSSPPRSKRHSKRHSKRR
jgi:hypothetical protein